MDRAVTFEVRAPLKCKPFSPILSFETMAGRPTKMTDRVKRAVVLLTKRQGWNQGAIASDLDMTGRTIAAALKADPDFKKDVEDAKSRFLRSLERVAMERAMKGVVKKWRVNDQGEREPSEVIYSDALLLHLMKANGRGKHSEHTIVDQNVNDVTPSRSLDLDKLTREERTQLKALLRKAAPDDEVAE